jgi:hypothetical protein
LSLVHYVDSVPDFNNKQQEITIFRRIILIDNSNYFLRITTLFIGENK